MDEIRSLTDRVVMLETKIRRQIAFTAFLVLALAATLVMGQAKALQPATTVHDELRAKRFSLVDDDGDCRGVLGFAPGSAIHGRSVPGTESAVLQLYPKGKGGGISLMVTHYGGPFLGFNDTDRKTRFAVRVLPDGNPVVWLIDENKIERLKLSLEGDGKPSILFKDEDGLETVFSP